MLTTIERPSTSQPHEEEHFNESDAPLIEARSLKERHPDWPNLNVRFYFSPHGSKADSAGIAPYLKEADIYIPENINREIAATFQTLSDASFVPQRHMVRAIRINGQPVEGSFHEPILRGIHKTKKVIGSIDLESNLPEEASLQERVNASPLPPKAPTFDEALENYKRYIAERAEDQEEREKVMTNRFEQEIERLLEANPHLKEKPSLNILLSIGSYHTQLAHAFNEQGIPTERNFSSPTYVYGYIDELQRNFAYGREPFPELVEKAYIQDVLIDEVTSGIKDAKTMFHDDFFKYMRSVIDRLTPDDRKAIFERYNNDSLDRSYINELLESRGIKQLPSSSQEFSSSAINEQGRIAKRLRSTGRKALGLFRSDR